MQDLNSHSSTYQYDAIFNGLPAAFSSRALELFKFQYLGNPLYRRFADRFNANPDSVHDLARIPFLPVTFFKNEIVQTGEFLPEIIFESSGTTGRCV